MLTHLEINNFKAWRKSGPIQLAPLSGFFGTNSSGKTSILQMLLMLKQTVESADRAQVLNLGDERSLADLGTFPDILHAHNLDTSLEWKLLWALADPLELALPTHAQQVNNKSVRSLSFQASVGWHTDQGLSQGKLGVNRFNYQANGYSFGMQANADKQHFDLQASGPDGFRLIRTPGRVWPLPAPTKFYGFPDQARAYYQEAGFLSDLELAFQNLFAGLYYLGPLREYPQRLYTWGGGRPTDMGQRGQRVIDALLASRDDGASISRGRGRNRTRLTLEHRVAVWLKQLGLISSFEIKPLQPGGKVFQALVKLTEKSPEVLITDVGFGVSQILPVITLCYYAPEGSTLILEQPEIHLHPSVQMGLADVFLDAIKSRRIQIILESHSEHLLRRLQRRVAEGSIAPDQAAFYFCSSRQGESHLDSLDLDLFGNIRNWPKDFFGDQFGEITAAQEAALERRSKETNQ